MSKMIVHTCFNNSSYHGYKSSILKSGICKYTRRGEKDKMKWCVMEMARFNEHEKGQGLVTNLINRLKILIMEELSFHQVGQIYYLIMLLSWFEEDRSQIRYLYTFTNEVFKCLRNRYVSYQNAWWRYEDYVDLDIPIDKIKEYQKKGDSEEVLKVGEALIYYIENDDERMFSCLNELLRLDKSNAKAGLRFRRKDPSYLWFEIIRDYMEGNQTQAEVIFNFALDQFNKKGMKERVAFAVWIGMYVWKSGDLTTDYTDIELVLNDTDEVDNYIDNMVKMEMDDYVVNDYHVNSHKFGLGKFAEEGALVIDEYLDFDDMAGEKKKFYIKEKKIRDKHKNVIKKDSNSEGVVKGGKDVKDEKEHLEFISWSEFNAVTILEDGVCGGKVCCISVVYKGKKYILKEMKESMNYGLDYILVDKCKEMFDLRHMNMRRIKSDQGQVKIDPKGKSYVGNVQIGKRECIYCMMDYWSNIGDLGKHKHIMSDVSVKKEALKIRLFDGLFRSSDNIPRNILVNDKNELLSIDEGDIFGKREKVFNKHDWFIKPENCDKQIFNDVLDDLLSDSFRKLKGVEELFKYYQFMNFDEFKERFSDYREIIMSEL